MTTSPNAAALAGAVEQLLTTLLQRRSVLGDEQPSPLSTFQAVALGVLADNGPLRLGALAEHLHTTDATASRTVDALSTHGFTERRNDTSDGRGILVVATSAGQRAVIRRRNRLALLLESLVADMAPAEGQRLAELLDELRELLARYQP